MDKNELFAYNQIGRAYIPKKYVQWEIKNAELYSF